MDSRAVDSLGPRSLADRRHPECVVAPFTRCRFLRNWDRDKHYDCYPFLHYPNLFILHGGYKEFFGFCKVRATIDGNRIWSLSLLRYGELIGNE
jgi:hypothetical protein